MNNNFDSSWCYNPNFNTSSFVPPTLQTAMSSVKQSSDINNRYFSNCHNPNRISFCGAPPPFPKVLRSIDDNSKELDALNSLAAGECIKAMTKSSVQPTGDEDEGNEVEELWKGNCNYSEYIENGASNLFICWSGTPAELIAKLCHYDLEVLTIYRTSDIGVCNVVFEKHITARKAFLMQREIKLRMIPPKNSRRNWFRCPSPKFLVKFETKCRLVVKKGKTHFHESVGELLMSDYRSRKGCIVWANQLKGHRLRIVCCEGNFKLPSGKVIEMKGVPTYSNSKTPLGWISYRNRRTKKMLVTRRSGNDLGDYIYTG
jgi:hypothetical protein